MQCESCKKEVHRIKKIGDGWFCNHCFRPEPGSVLSYLHKKRILKDYGPVSEARLEMMKRRVVSRDDNKTVIDWKTGKESQNY